MVRAKFKCVNMDTNSYDPEGENLKNIRLEAVINDSEENKSFFRWTPSGTVTMGCVNPAANSQFEVGKEYYVDFSPVE